MSCQTPYRGDSAQLLLFKIASCCFDGSGVTSFNGRDGAVTLLASDVTPVADDIYVNETGDSMSGLLDITTSATSLQAITSDAGVANTPETIQIFHKTSAVPATGFGNRLQFYADTDGGSDQIQARIDAQWVDAVDATRSSRLVFGIRNTGGVISSPLILANGQLQLLDGTAAIPSLSFQNDTDVGVFRAAADTIGFSTVGVERVRISSLGRVGIGTSAPAAKLHISGADADGIYLANGTTKGIRYTFTATTSFIEGVDNTGFASFQPLYIQGSTLFFGTSGITIVSIVNPDFILAVGKRLAFTSGANQRAGNAVLVAGTVTIANTSVTGNTLVFLTRKITGGTIGFAVTYTVIPSTSFTITSDNVLDTSTYSYMLLEVP